MRVGGKNGRRRMQMEVSKEMLFSSDRHPGYSRISQKGIQLVSVTKCQEGQGIARAASAFLCRLAFASQRAFLLPPTETAARTF